MADLKTKPSLRTKLGTAFAAAAIALVGGYEGLRLTAYRDTGGVATICYGATAGVQIGQQATPADCAARLTGDLAKHEVAMRQCLTAPDALPEKVYLAILDFTYNVGAGAACGSTLFRKLNAGDVRGACAEFQRWVYDNGRVIPGLVNRRQGEAALCMSGLQ